MKHFKKQIFSLFVLLGFSINIKANIEIEAKRNTSIAIPVTFSGFKCTEVSFGNLFKTVEHGFENGNQILILKEWSINEVVSSERYQITNVEMQGGALIRISGIEMSLNMGTQAKSFDLLLATTQIENHSILVQPSEAELICQF